jgi:HNH endonuclease
MPPNIYFPSKGACIYCGKSNILLTDEHVVPFFIGGKHIIRKASCVMCANITKKFEQDVGRGLWGDARASYSAPTRRKKERAKSFVLKDLSGNRPDLIIPAERYPAPFAFFRMPIAGLLCGVEPTTDLRSKWTMEMINDATRQKEFLDKYPGRLTASMTIVPKSFGRMLAKIGHCHAMTALDIGDFTPICLPYILGKRSNISYVVGGVPTNEPLQPELGYSLKAVQASSADRTLIVVEVRLLANNHTPTYHVVVGEVIGRENMKRIDEKLNAIYPSGKNIDYIVGNAPAEIPWAPSIWPVKT